MRFPDVWATILLDAPADAAALAAQLSASGVSTIATREGWLALGGDFLARVEARPYPADLLAHPGATDRPTRAHAACLHVSGGGLDVDRPVLETQTAMRAPGGAEPTKTTRFQKVEALAALLARMPRWGEGVVLPAAGHRFVPWASWPTTGAGQVFGAAVTLARAGRMLVTRGMRLFGVPDVGGSLEGTDVGALSRSLFDAAFEIAWQGFVPSGPASLSAFVDRAAGTWQLAPVARDGLWLVGNDRAASAELAMRANLATIVGSHLFDDPDAQGEIGVAAFGGLERRVMTTVGLHRHPRSDGPIEVTAMMPSLSRYASYALRELGKMIAASGEAIQPQHRVALPPLEPYGIAGVVLWVSGRVGLGPGTSQLTLWEAIPITPDELARFRAGEQGAWMEEVQSQGAFPRLQARWCAR